MRKKDVLYYARIIPTCSVYEVCEIIIRTIEDDYFVGIDKHDKHAYIFSYDCIGDTVFGKRRDALNKVLEAECSKD